MIAKTDFVVQGKEKDFMSTVFASLEGSLSVNLRQNKNWQAFHRKIQGRGEIDRNVPSSVYQVGV